MLSHKDRLILQKIVDYCDQIHQTVERFGADFDIYSNDFVYRNACSMCILQIGELVSKLSDEVIQQNTDIPWRGIKATRNILAHAYNSADLVVIWSTIQNNIPSLKSKCQRILTE